MAVTVRAARTEDVIHVVRPPPELGVERPDPRVNDVHVHPSARRRVGVRAVKRERALIDPVEPPRLAARTHLLGPLHAAPMIGQMRASGEPWGLDRKSTRLNSSH